MLFLCTYTTGGGRDDLAGFGPASLDETYRTGWTVGYEKERPVYSLTVPCPVRYVRYPLEPRSLRTAPSQRGISVDQYHHHHHPEDVESRLNGLEADRISRPARLSAADQAIEASPNQINCNVPFQRPNCIVF